MVRAVRLALLSLLLANVYLRGQGPQSKDSVTRLVAEALTGNKSALRRLHSKALNGSAAAQSALGDIYYHSLAVPENLSEEAR